MQAAVRNSTIGSGSRRNGWFPPFRFFYGAVAACLVIVAGLVFYLAEVSPQKRTKDVARKTTTPASVLPAQQDTTALQSIAGDSSGVATAVTRHNLPRQNYAVLKCPTHVDGFTIQVVTTGDRLP